MCVHAKSVGVHMCVPACVCVNVHACMYVSVCMCIHMYVCVLDVCERACVHMHVLYAYMSTPFKCLPLDLPLHTLRFNKKP